MHFTVPREVLEPLIKEVVSQVLDEREKAGSRLTQQLYDLNQAAQVLGISYDQLREEVRSGRLRKIVRPGAKRHFISRDELLRFLTSTKENPEKSSPGNCARH